MSSLALRKEQFNLRMQQATGQQTKSHLITQRAQEDRARQDRACNRQKKAS